MEAERGRLAGEAQHLLGGHEDQAGVGGVVAVGRVQRGAAGAERPVEPELDRAHREVAVADRLGAAALAVLSPRLLAGERGEYPERKSAAPDQAGVGGDRAQIEPGLVRAGEPLGQALGDHRLHRGVEPLLGRRRHQGADQVLGQVDQDPGGLPALVLRDAAARRVGGVAPDARALERGPAGPRGVAVDAHQRHRVPGRGAIERGARGEALARPAGLVPAAAGDPLPRAEPRCGGADRAGDLVLGARGGQVQLEARAGEQHEVAVSVDQAGQHGAAREIEDGLAGSRVDVGAPAREGDAPVADHEGVDHRAGGVERVDPPVGQEHVGAGG